MGGGGFVGGSECRDLLSPCENSCLEEQPVAFVDSVTIDCERIVDWDTFHDEFARAFGFPSFYGRNMNAWIDCLTSIDCPEDSMTEVHCHPGSCLNIQLLNAGSLKERIPELVETLEECAAFVNFRRIERGQKAVLSLSYSVE